MLSVCSVEIFFQKPIIGAAYSSLSWSRGLLVHHLRSERKYGWLIYVGISFYRIWSFRGVYIELNQINNMYVYMIYNDSIPYPIGSMYCIFSYIYLNKIRQMWVKISCMDPMGYIILYIYIYSTCVYIYTVATNHDAMTGFQVFVVVALLIKILIFIIFIYIQIEICMCILP